MPLTELDDWAKRAIDEAIHARQDGRADDALRLGAELLQRLGPDHRGWIGVVHSEMGYVLLRLSKQPERAEEHFRRAVELLPRAELASLGLFHALAAQRRWEDALREIVRFVEAKDSPEYRELLSHGFRRDLSPTGRALADEARRLLARWN